MDAQRPNWVQIGTFVVAVGTGVVSIFVAFQTFRLSELEREFSEFRAQTEVRTRLLLFEPPFSCGLQRVQLNKIWQEYTETYCGVEGANAHRLALLAVSAGDGEYASYAPRITVSLTRSTGEVGAELSKLEPNGETLEVGIGLIEEGAALETYVPLAIVDANGRLAEPDYLYPRELRWHSLVTGEEAALEMNWFAPRDQWISTDAATIGQ